MYSLFDKRFIFMFLFHAKLIALEQGSTEILQGRAKPFLLLALNYDCRLTSLLWTSPRQSLVNYLERYRIGEVELGPKNLGGSGMSVIQPEKLGMLSYSIIF